MLQNRGGPRFSNPWIRNRRRKILLILFLFFRFLFLLSCFSSISRLIGQHNITHECWHRKTRLNSIQELFSNGKKYIHTIWTYIHRIYDGIRRIGGNLNNRSILNQQTVLLRDMKRIADHKATSCVTTIGGARRLNGGERRGGLVA